MKHIAVLTAYIASLPAMERIETRASPSPSPSAISYLSLLPDDLSCTMTAHFPIDHPAVVALLESRNTLSDSYVRAVMKRCRYEKWDNSLAFFKDLCNKKVHAQLVESHTTWHATFNNAVKALKKNDVQHLEAYLRHEIGDLSTLTSDYHEIPEDRITQLSFYKEMQYYAALIKALKQEVPSHKKSEKWESHLWIGTYAGVSASAVIFTASVIGLTATQSILWLIPLTGGTCLSLPCVGAIAYCISTAYSNHRYTSSHDARRMVWCYQEKIEALNNELRRALYEV